jgi:hypothetical protein
MMERKKRFQKSSEDKKYIFSARTSRPLWQTANASRCDPHLVGACVGMSAVYIVDWPLSLQSLKNL